MNQREFWDWYHLDFCPKVRRWCMNRFGGDNIDGAYVYTNILEQCRTLFHYEGLTYSYLNFQAIFEKWMEEDFEPDLLQWVENDRKRHGVWSGSIERPV